MLSIITSFVFSGLVQIIILIFKGEAGFTGTYKAYAYGMIPFVIISAVPFVGWLSFIYGLVLMIIGVSRLQKISSGKATIACLIPIVVLMALIFGLVFFFLLAVFRAF